MQYTSAKKPYVSPTIHLEGLLWDAHKLTKIYSLFSVIVLKEYSGLKNAGMMKLGSRVWVGFGEKVAEGKYSLLNEFVSQNGKIHLFGPWFQSWENSC